MEYNENNTPICPVCFEVIGSINQCITPCGHTFCLICMLKCIKLNNSCPCCRTIIIENNEDDESYSESYYEDNEREEIEENDDYDTDSTPEDYNTENEPYVEPYEDTYLVSLDYLSK